MDECVTLKILNPISTSREKLNAQVIGHSDPGATLRMKAPILIGTMVQVRFPDRIALGEVRGCNPSGGEFVIEVDFQDVLNMGDTA